MSRRQTRRPGQPGYVLDPLEPRQLLAVSAELRWMIQHAGGATPPSPALTVSSNLPTTGGYAQTANPATVSFSGAADPASAASVKVNNVTAAYDSVTGAWSLANGGNTIALRPGINRVQVRSYDAAGAELTRKTLDVWYDDGSVQSVSGTLSGAQTWTAAGGPYLVTGNVTVTNGASLTIEPGTSVYFAANTRLVVNGRLSAQGSEFQHIRFTRNPAAANPTSWASIEFRNTQQENRVAFADVEYASSASTTRAVRVDFAALYLDHVSFAHVNRQYLDISSSSVDVRHTVFPDIPSGEPIHAGGMLNSGTSFAVFIGNVHGKTTGYNDIMDFTGGQRPGPILQVRDSWFLGGQDDGLDFDSTDAWIENNVFLDFHQPQGRNTPSSKSHPISTGNEGGGTTEITITRNFFYDNDHAILIKDAASGTIVNNTIVDVHTLPGATEPTTAAINLHEVRSGQYQGARIHVEGNIFHDVSRLFELPTPFPAGHPELVSITLARNVLPAAGTNALAGATVTVGPGNTSANPLFVSTANVLDPTVDLQLQSNSPAKGAGPNGADMGAAIPAGVSLSGEPPAFTNIKHATLAVGFNFGAGTNAAGYLAYRYRVNNGAYSAETPAGTPINLIDLPDGAYTVYAIGKDDAGVWQPESQATASGTWIVDTTAPRVLAPAFAYDLAAHALVLQFNEDLAQVPAKSVLSLTNLTTHQPVPLDTIALVYDPDTRTATFTFPGQPNGRLPAGGYRATLAAATLTDRASNALDGNADNTPGDDSTFDFFHLPGDANHDGAVDFNDLVMLAQHYNAPTTQAWLTGDFTYDGVVDFNDLVVLAQNYGSILTPPPSPVDNLVDLRVGKMPAAKRAFCASRI